MSAVLGADAAFDALKMRGVASPSPREVMEEAGRMLGLQYHYGTGMRRFPPSNVMVCADDVGEFLASQFPSGMAKVMAFRTGDLVERVDGRWKYGVVKGYGRRTSATDDCYLLDIEAGTGRLEEASEGQLLRGDVRLATLPKEIMDIARAQLARECPLMKGACDGSQH